MLRFIITSPGLRLRTSHIKASTSYKYELIPTNLPLYTLSGTGAA